MILRVDDTDNAVDENTYTLKPNLLQDKAVHLFIASNEWELLDIKLTDDIPQDTLKYVITKCKDVKVRKCSTINKHTMHLLCELYPDKAGIIRKNFMLGRDVWEVLK